MSLAGGIPERPDRCPEADADRCRRRAAAAAGPASLTGAVQKWLDLLTPSAAALSLLLAIALVVQAVRHGRAVRRLESRLAEREGAGARVSVDRLAELQRRAKTSSLGTGSGTGWGIRRPGAVAALAAVVVLLGLGGWYLFLRGDSGSASSSSTTTTSTTQKPRPVANASTTVPENPEALPQSKSAYTVLVLNGTTIPRAAGSVWVPAVQRFGYNTAPAGDATSKDVKRSFVMYLPGREAVADNVAHDLGIKQKLPLDGLEVTQDTSSVDAVVVLGLDLASGRTP